MRLTPRSNARKASGTSRPNTASAYSKLVSTVNQRRHASSTPPEPYRGSKRARRSTLGAKPGCTRRHMKLRQKVSAWRETSSRTANSNAISSEADDGSEETSFMVLTTNVYFRSARPAKRYSGVGVKSSESELMQYRVPRGPGPSSKTWPRCESQRLHRTSIRCMPWL